METGEGAWRPGESLYGAEPPADRPRPQGFRDQLLGVFTAPGEVFRRLKDAPAWVWPGVFTIVAMVAISLVWAHKVDMEIFTRGQMETASRLFGAQITEAQIQAKLDTLHGQPYLGSILNVILGFPLICLLLGLVNWAFSTMGSTAPEGTTFRQSFAVATVHYLAMAPASLLTLLVLLARPVGGASLVALTPTHLGFFLHPESPLLRGLLCLADPFYLYSYVLLFFGLRHTLTMKTWAIVLDMGFVGLFGLLLRAAGGAF
jgi:hypothetical protein